MSSAVNGVIGINCRFNHSAPVGSGADGSGALDRAPLQQLADVPAPAAEDLVDGDQVVACDGVELGHPGGLGKEQLLTLCRGELGRLAAHLRGELELPAALERAEAAAEMELDAVVVAEARLDVGAAQRITTARALAPAHLCPKNPEDDLLHLEG